MANNKIKLSIPLMLILFPIVICWVIYAWFADLFLMRRFPGLGYKYIKVNDDGTARELTSEERKYLEEKFHPADGGRPYIKFGYEMRTPVGKLGGFLKRRHLPPNIKVDPF
jgi:hypothetical protein